VVYFIYQAIASILIVSGILSRYIGLNSYLFIIGVFTKLGMFPFHLWVLPVLSGCRHLITFTLLIPIKLPVYILTRGMSNLIVTIRVLSIVTGVILAINQSSLIKIIIRSRIRSSGVLVVRLNFDMFWIYFRIYSLTLLFFLDGIYFNNNRVIFLRLISFLGIPFLPIFIPKVNLLMARLISTPFLALFILLTFLISSLYYVKFLPSLVRHKIS